MSLPVDSISESKAFSLYYCAMVCYYTCGQYMLNTPVRRINVVYSSSLGGYWTLPIGPQAWIMLMQCLEMAIRLFERHKDDSI
jgi:hypothetical protein